MPTLKDKVAIITGAGRGIGMETALLLAKEGAKVIVNDLGANPDGSGHEKIADEVVAEIKALGGEAVANYDSVDSYEGGIKIFNTAMDAFGAVDIVINNAGILRDKTLFNMEESDWDAIMAVHLKGHFNCTQPFVRYIRETNRLNCRIINMSSVGAKGFVDVSNAIYAGTKGAILSMTKTSSQELGEHNINVNSICPAPTYTDIVKKLVEKRAKEKKISKQKMIEYYMRNVPLGRFNETEDISSMVLFLCSEGARNITGQSFNIDGGLIPS